MAVNMTKRAAAGAIYVSAQSHEGADGPFRRANLAPVFSRGTSREIIAPKYDLARIIAGSLIMLTALSSVSYAAYEHQWSELSALRHLGKATGK
jgi:hypothetical protein